VKIIMNYRDDIKKIIQEAVNLTMPIDNVNLDTDLQSMGMDSISFIKIVIGIENMFGIEFPDEKLLIKKAGTLKDLCGIVNEEISKKEK